MFPFGWTCSEYVVLDSEDQFPYEVRLQSASRPTFLAGSVGHSPDTAWQAGVGNRRSKVEDILKSWLRFGSVQSIFGYRRKNIKVKSDPWRDYGQPASKEDFDHINVEHSTIGRLVSRQIEVWVDPVSLTENIFVETERRGAKEKINWGAIEAWCRDEIEAGRPSRDCQGRRQLVNAAADWYSSLPNAPADIALSNDQVAKRMAPLFDEYEFEK